MFPVQLSVHIIKRSVLCIVLGQPLQFQIIAVNTLIKSSEELKAITTKRNAMVLAIHR